ncbi:DEAD/DEAH box helicase [bacterium]|nr:DEAD/DEAH box helicase [bacterium]
MTYDISRIGIDSLNAMQQDMLEASRRHDTIVLLSPTGSGKTLAYLLPVLERIDAAVQSLQAVVLVPSRELAMQTAAVAKAICPDSRPMACYGGRPAMDEHRMMRGLQPRIVVATPGRMIDHLAKGNIQTDDVKMLVVDEFDKSLELGFLPQMEEVMAALRHVRRRILLSATDCPQIPRFVSTTDFFRLSYLVDEEQIPDRITLHTVTSPDKDKLETLGKLLCTLGNTKSLVFVGFRQSVERVQAFLTDKGFFAGMYHGGMEQRDRERSLYRFINGSCNVLVSTDLASRGLDIPGVDNVVHYHLPLDEESYIHRNGRTARWDADGDAYMLLGPTEVLPDYVRDTAVGYGIPSDCQPPSEPKWVTLYIGKGKKDKIGKGDVAGFLSKVGGLERDQIGRIDILPGWSYAAVSRAGIRLLLSRIRGQKIKGIKTVFQIAE